MIDSKKLIFTAQTVQPMSGSTRQLTGEYQLKLSGDSLIVYLPYFGRAYNAPYGGEGGITFTSTSFDYKVNSKRKRWDISFKPKDNQEVRQLILSITESGFASLHITSTNRQPISFSGYVK